MQATVAGKDNMELRGIVLRIVDAGDCLVASQVHSIVNKQLQGPKAKPQGTIVDDSDKRTVLYPMEFKVKILRTSTGKTTILTSIEEEKEEEEKEEEVDEEEEG